MDEKKAVVLLLDADVELNAKDGFGWTALRKALVNDHADIAELLRSRGAKDLLP